ncbi:MAG: FecR domain-containing protein [Spirochaetes bacterium]|jgi:hypothetical protein|nr:FecR domain-containing protein [Spirochaetota bacterium]
MKKNSKSLSNDLIFTIICFLILGSTAYALYVDINTGLDFTRDQQVGTIIFKRNSAQRKHAQHPQWEHLEKTSPLFNNDSIRTGKDSDARLILDGELEVALRQQTLIFVSLHSRGFEINFEGGEIHSIAKTRLQIKYRNSSIVVKQGTNFSLQEIEDGTVELTINKGSASVKNAGTDSIKTVADNETATITSQNIHIQSLVFKNCYPPNNILLISSNDQMRVPFDWDSITQTAQLTIATDPEFKNQIFNKETNSHKLELTPMPMQMQYYWKLSSGNNESPVYNFSIVQERPPLIVQPSDGSTITPAQAGQPATFGVTWLTRAEADSYTVTLYKDGDDQPVVTRETRNNSLSITARDSGLYRIIVTPRYHFSSSTDSMQSEPVTINITNEATHAGPAITSPADGSVVPLLPSILASWSSTGNSYRVNIYRIGNDDTPEATILTAKNSALLSGDFRPGTYTLSVASLNNDGSEDTTTTTFTFDSEPGLSLITPSEGSNFLPEESIPFSWKDPSVSLLYELEIASDSSFQTLITKTKSKLFREKENLGEPGIYYARVNIIRSDSPVINGQTRIFSVPKKIEAPKLDEDSHLSEINTTITPSIRASWNKISGAGMYKASLIQIGEAMTEKTVNTITTASTSAEFTNTRSLAPGRYCIEITALDKKDELLTAQSDKTRHYFLASRQEGLKIKTPQTIFILVK